MTRSDRYWFTALGTIAAGIGAVDVWRDRCRDDSTLSCGVRRLVALVPGGRYLLAVGLAAAGLGFFRHIVRPLAAAVTDHTPLSS